MTTTPTDPQEAKPRLWILTLRRDLQKPGTMNGAVVVSHDEENARDIASIVAGSEGTQAWLNHQHSKCELLEPFGGLGVIMRSDHPQQINPDRHTPIKSPTLKHWFGILSQKTDLMCDHERLTAAFLRHLFVSTIQHLQLGYSLIHERRLLESSIPNQVISHLLKNDGPLTRPSPPPRPTPPPPPPQDDKIKVWWESEDRFAHFVALAKPIVSKAYDLTRGMPTWRHREKSPLGKYLNTTLILCNVKTRPKNPRSWQTSPDADQRFAISILKALRSSASNLKTEWSANLSHLLADLERHLGLHPSYPKRTLENTKPATEKKPTAKKKP